MDFFATPLRKRLLLASLYLSEGAPIGFIWLALPTRLRASGVDLEQITYLAALLVLPWTLKFAWAPLVDLLCSARWTLRHWIITAQSIMGITLIPLLWLDLRADFRTIAALLLAHAVSAATQDVAIDALCISVTRPGERGQYNGWMQAGMLLGRALMGGGALVLGSYIGDAPVVGLLIGLTTFSMVLLALSKPPANDQPDQGGRGQAPSVLRAARTALTRRNTWLGLLFAFVGPAAFKSLEVVYGPFLIDRGYARETIGWFSAGPMILSMIVGALVGGWLADRVGHRRFVAVALLLIVTSTAALALYDMLQADRPGLLLLLAMTAFGIGLFTAGSYALFMDITEPSIAATQFSAYMGATNGCESWSSYAIGQIIAAGGYPPGLLAMSAASLLALPLLSGMRYGAIKG